MRHSYCSHWQRPQRTRRGAMLVILAVALPLFIIMAAFAVNVAYMELTRTELRAATDFAARAGARTLSLNGDQASATLAALEAANRNRVAGMPLVLTADDLEFGHVSPNGTGGFQFAPGGGFPNGVRVVGDGIGTGNGVSLFFNGFVGSAPFDPTLVATAGQIDRDIALVLDRSGSMAKLTPEGDSTGWAEGQAAPADSRWAKAVEGSIAFLNALAATPMAEKISLVTYHGEADIDVDLTFTYTQMPTALDTYTQNYIDGWTNIGDGIEVGRESLLDHGLSRSWAQKTIVVLTDGIHNTGEYEPQDTAAMAAAAGVTVHTITFGNDANQTDMQEVADIGGGRHWHAPTGEALIDVFNEIANNIPTMLIE